MDGNGLDGSLKDGGCSNEVKMGILEWGKCRSIVVSGIKETCLRLMGRLTLEVSESVQWCIHGTNVHLNRHLVRDL